jgi:hypothetical protein
MVDPDANRYPVPLLLRWKDMSENVLNYSAPIIAFGNRGFLDGGRSPSILGSHLTIGPTNLDGICTECWIEGFSWQGAFKLEAERFYETGRNLEVILRDDWHPFLTRKGMDKLTLFKGVLAAQKFIAYRIGVNYQIFGRDFEFHSLWQLGKLTHYQNAIFHFNRKTGSLLVPWIDWAFANSELPEVKQMLAVFDSDEFYIRTHTWTETLQPNSGNGFVWRADGLGVKSCQGKSSGDVSFGFIQESIRVAMVVSAKNPPTDQLIVTDQLPLLIKVE